ncbi:MAG: UDP-N-acetylmuramoyl-L-alanyl-D-glutamate--2,6-diaminopimelate ligase [Nevskiales bacterium]
MSAYVEPVARAQRLPDLLAGWASAVPDLEIGAVAVDSREVTPGALFLACQGGHSHGLAHLDEAFRRGATAVAWEPAAGVKPPRADLPNIEVPALSARVGEIAARMFDAPSTRLFVVGITGTDGKTSTAHLISQALAQLGTRCGYLGTLGYGFLGALAPATHTTPDAVQLQRWLARLLASGAQAVALEASSHALDQSRVNGVQFDVAVLTNVTRDHLDYHGDVSRYAAAKRKLFAMPGLRTAIMNQDDACGAEWLRDLAGNIDGVAYGIGSSAHPAALRHVLADEPELTAQGLRLYVRSSWGEGVLDSALLGRFNAYNLLAALAVLLEKGEPLPRALAALNRAVTVPGRMQALRRPGKPLVVVDYAHTPEAVTQALRAARAHCSGKLVCVFGCGGDRDRGKRPLMAQAVAQAADLAVVTDDNPRSEAPQAIVRDIVAGLPPSFPYEIQHDRGKAIRQAIAAAAARDVVLIAGKGHEDYQIYGAERRHFSDVETAQALLGASA